MTRIMWVGDTHANTQNMEIILERACFEKIDQIIQLGDFGWWPRYTFGQKFIEYTNKKIKKLGLNPLIFIPGNHEDWHSLETAGVTGPYLHKLTDYIYMAGKGYIHTIGNKTLLFVGGAQSVDKSVRTQGVDWFAEEEISQKECNDICDFVKFVDKPIDIMVCHDTIDGIHLPVKIIEGYGNVRRALRAIADVAKPDRIIHGHYHINYWVNELLWGRTVHIRGLSHDNSPITHQVLVEEL